jgi:predicted outer membrane repeat protein
MAPSVSAGSPPYVGPGGGSGGCAAPVYSTIQGAVDAVPSGTIHICAGTYSLAATITVSKVLTFVGDGAGSTIIDGGSSLQLFSISATSASFSGLTLENGLASGAGGAIYATSTGTVSVTNSTFSGNVSTHNSGGAIYSKGTGTVSVTNSTFSNNACSGGNGGAIYAKGTVSVTNSTFSGNQANIYGGAIYATGTGTFSSTNSTFSSNQAGIAGGAIYANGSGTVSVTNSTFSTNSGNQANSYGGAIFANGPLSVTNSTFSGNSADTGGAIYAEGTFDVTNSTFSGNSASSRGTIYTDASGTVTNSILAQGATGRNCWSGITSGGGNFSTDSSCDTSTVVLSASDLHLGTLASNGGPTQTIALGAGSVAIDAGVDGLCPATDQRGVSRPRGAHCDAGAYEAPGGPVTSASNSTVVASPTSVTADGTTTSTITVTLLDASLNPVSGKTVTLAKSSGPGSPTISAASGPSNGSGVVTFTVKSTTAGADAFQATDTDDSLVITPTATVTFIIAGVLDHITLSPSSATITGGGSQAYTATGFAADGSSWDATASITFTIDGGGSCNGALCTATVAGDHIVTGTDTVGGTILATATLHVDAAGATPTPAPMATPTPSRAATPPPTSTGVGPASDGPASTISFLPVALVAFFGCLLLLVIRRRRRVF